MTSSEPPVPTATSAIPDAKPYAYPTLRVAALCFLAIQLFESAPRIINVLESFHFFGISDQLFALIFEAQLVAMAYAMYWVAGSFRRLDYLATQAFGPPAVVAITSWARWGNIPLFAGAGVCLMYGISELTIVGAGNWAIKTHWFPILQGAKIGLLGLCYEDLLRCATRWSGWGNGNSVNRRLLALLVFVEFSLFMLAIAFWADWKVNNERNIKPEFMLLWLWDVAYFIGVLMLVGQVDIVYARWERPNSDSKFKSNYYWIATVCVIIPTIIYYIWCTMRVASIFPFIPFVILVTAFGNLTLFGLGQRISRAAPIVREVLVARTDPTDANEPGSTFTQSRLIAGGLWTLFGITMGHLLAQGYVPKSIGPMVAGALLAPIVMDLASLEATFANRRAARKAN